jgi:hypothetical protein
MEIHYTDFEYKEYFCTLGKCIIQSLTQQSKRMAHPLHRSRPNEVSVGHTHGNILYRTQPNKVSAGYTHGNALYKARPIQRYNEKNNTL